MLKNQTKSRFKELCSALPGLGIFFVFLWLGKLTQQLHSSPIPGVILGMILFLSFTLIIKDHFKKVFVLLKNSSNFFLPLLPFFILPSGVGVLNQLELLRQDSLSILIALTIGLLLTQIITPKLYMALKGSKPS